MSCTPSRYAMFPGMTLIRPDMIVLLPILSGALERPFYSVAGYTDRKSILAFSIQANLLAMLATVAATIVGYIVLASVGRYVPNELTGILAFVGLPLLAAVVKFAWFARVPREDLARRGFGSFILATAVSTVTIASIPFWMSLFGTDRSSYADQIRGIQAVAILLTFVTAFVTHIAIFGRFRRPPRSEFAARGFEVIPTVAPVVPLQP